MDKETKSFIYYSIFMFISLVTLAIFIGLYTHWLILLAVCLYIVLSFFKSLRMILNLYEKDIKTKNLKKEINDLKMMITILSRDRD
jgi:hypothetical protein